MAVLIVWVHGRYDPSEIGAGGSAMERISVHGDVLVLVRGTVKEPHGRSQIQRLTYARAARLGGKGTHVPIGG
jgi:hypothetical protein